MKKTKILVAVSLATLLLAPGFSFAQVAGGASIADLQAQLQALLKQVAALRAQINAAQTGEGYCHNFEKNLRIGDQGDDVRSLQSTLQREGFNISKDEINNGQYGEGTAAAVSGFQEKYGADILGPNGLKFGTGFTGNSTRVKLNKLYACGKLPPATSSITVVSPNGGESWVKGKTQTIQWKDGAYYLNCSAGSNCAENLIAARYDITLSPYYPPCTGEICPAYPFYGPYTIAKGVFGSSYDWTVGRAGNYEKNFIPDGQYTVQVCRAGTDACDSSDNYFNITSASTTGQPVISGVSGPSVLKVGDQGTWAVKAYDPNGGTLSYSVVWGDENYQSGTAASTAQPIYQQTATFTHVYNTAGNYSPKFTVANANSSAQTSLSVSVSGQASVPSITNMTPTNGQVGATVTLSGQNFTPTGNTVHFGYGVIPNVSAQQWAASTASYPNPAQASGWTLTFNVPGSLDPACRFTTPVCAIMSLQTTPGVYPVSVTNANGTSNAVNFTVTAATSTPVAPVISSVSPQSGPIGTSVTVTGTGFTSSTLMMSGAPVATIPSSYGTSFTFTVPSQLFIAAGCTGPSSACAQAAMDIGPGVYPLTVAGPNGTSNAVNFTVTSATTVPNLRISSPAAGDNWPLTTGQQVKMALTSMPVGTKYDVVLKSTTMATPDLLFLQSGTLSPDATGAASLNVTVPNVPVGTYVIYARGVYNNQVVADNTSATFNIVSAPAISIVSPVAGDSWTVGSSKQISFKTSNIPSTAKYDVTLEYAGGASYYVPNVILLQNSATLPNPLSTIVPNVSAGQYYIYARAVVGTTVYEAKSGVINVSLYPIR